ncbi:type II secretion system F family protein [Candidatus Woesearchaeota archaeon]|nr:type II secretion system F family protein [Candidatus Woesearchaeota archaeon]
MEFKIEIRHILFVILGVLLIIADFYFFYGKEDLSRWFKPVLVVAVVLMALQYFLDFFHENKVQKEIEVKFLEFIRALVETVKSGVSIPKAIREVSKEDYGYLTPHVRKLANQLEWGFPLHAALVNFAKDTNNRVIAKSVSIVIEAEKSGGNMGEVLEAIASSVFSIKKIKEERKASVYSQMVQGYIIYFVFIAIMLVMQVYLMPKISALGSDVGAGLGSSPLAGTFGGGAKISGEYMDQIFVYLVIIQGFFAGLLIGKFSEGELKYGVKHALILVILGYLIISTVRGV